MLTSKGDILILETYFTIFQTILIFIVLCIRANSSFLPKTQTEIAKFDS